MNNCECPLAKNCDAKPGYFECAKKLMELAAEKHKQKNEIYKSKIVEMTAMIKALIEDIKTNAIDVDSECLCNSCTNPDCKGLSTGNYFINPEYIVLECNGYTKK